MQMNSLDVGFLNQIILQNTIKILDTLGENIVLWRDLDSVRS
jgi:hypothetical protein